MAERTPEREAFRRRVGFFLNGIGIAAGDTRISPDVTAEDIVEERARAREIEEGRERAKSAAAEVAHINEEIAHIELAIKTAEKQRQRQQHDEFNARVEAEARAMAERRAAKGKAPLDLPELRSRAARKLANRK